MTSTRNRSNRVQRLSQVAGRLSTPDTPSRSQPGGRCSRVSMVWKSSAQPEAGKPVRPAFDAAVGHQVEVSLTHLHPLPRGVAQAGDEARLLVDRHLPELDPLPRLQAPGPGQLPADAIPQGVAPAAEVEPEIPAQGQAVGGGLRVAAADLRRGAVPPPGAAGRPAAAPSPAAGGSGAGRAARRRRAGPRAVPGERRRPRPPARARGPDGPRAPARPPDLDAGR